MLTLVTPGDEVNRGYFKNLQSHRNGNCSHVSQHVVFEFSVSGKHSYAKHTMIHSKENTV